MRKTLFFILFLNLVSIFSFSQTFNGIWIGKTYTDNVDDDTLQVGFNFYEYNDTLEGVCYKIENYDGVDPVFCTIKNDTVSGYLINHRKEDTVNLSGFIRNDSLLISFVSATDPDDKANGVYLKITDEVHTLRVNFEYTGTKTDNVAIGIFDDSDFFSTNEGPIVELKSSSHKGHFILPGLPGDTVYVAAYTDFDHQYNYFHDCKISCTLYGDLNTMEPYPVKVVSGQNDVINLSFDDSYEYTMPASFPGGKLKLVDTLRLDYYPTSMSGDTNGHIFVCNDLHAEIYEYTPELELEDTLRDQSGIYIGGSRIAFDSNNDFIVSRVSNIKKYSSSGELLNTINNPLNHTQPPKVTVDKFNCIYIATDTLMYKYSADLSERLDSIGISQIVKDYPNVKNNDPEIESFAFDNNGDLAICIDTEGDSLNALVYYDEDMSTFIRSVWQKWLFLKASGIAFDHNNYAYVVDRYRHVVTVLDDNDKLYAASYYEKQEGSEDGAMRYPEDIFIGNNKLYVNERYNAKRISVFELVTPPEKQYSVTFHISCNKSTVSGGTVRFAEKDYTINPEGTVVIEDIEAGSYEYQVTANGFETLNGTIYVENQDVVKNLTLSHLVYSITFNLNDGDKAVSNASISFNDNSYFSDANGSSTITGIMKGTYSYSVSASGFKDYSGSIEITNTNVVENISMERNSTTDFISGKIESAVLYPNPMKEFLVIPVKEKANFVEIINLSGKLIKRINLTTINESQKLVWKGKDDNNKNVKPGIYFIRVHYLNKIETYKVIKE